MLSITGDLWILESPFPNLLAAGDFLSFTVVFLNGSSDSSVDFTYTVSVRKVAQKGPNQDGEIIKSYHINTTLGPRSATSCILSSSSMRPVITGSRRSTMRVALQAVRSRCLRASSIEDAVLDN